MPLASLFLLVLVGTFPLRVVFVTSFFRLNVFSPFDVSPQRTISLPLKPVLASSCALPDAFTSSAFFLQQTISQALSFHPQPLDPSPITSESFGFSLLNVVFPALFSHLLPLKLALQVVAQAFSSLFEILLSSERAV